MLLYSCHLRQQTQKKDDFPNACPADFVAPPGIPDYLGAFAVTGGLEEDTLAAQFDAAHDDYNKIMVKALADRLAEGFAEYLHEQVRKTIWGYSPDENLDNDSLIRENYQDPPCTRYPACPNIRRKAKSGNCWMLKDIPACG